MNKSICIVSYNGDKHYRLDGPAVDWADDKQWFYMDKHINCKSQEEFKRLIKLKAFW